VPTRWAVHIELQRGGVLEQLGRSGRFDHEPFREASHDPNGHEERRRFGAGGLVTTEMVGRVRTYKLGPSGLEEEAAWIERYRQRWVARFDELEKLVEELKQKEKADEGKRKY
jgi:hypothetical protein